MFLSIFDKKFPINNIHAPLTVLSVRLRGYTVTEQAKIRGKKAFKKPSYPETVFNSNQYWKYSSSLMVAAFL